MKLYYKPGACSLTPHIILHEAGLAFETEKVDFATKKTDAGADYLALNPKGYVPLLQLDDGQMLTEVAAIVQYLGDRAPEKRLVPPSGTMERYRLQEWLSYISSELHKGFNPLFNPKAPEEWKILVKEMLARRIDFIAKHLEGKDYLMGETFTVADAYLFNVMNWARLVKVDLTPWPVLKTFSERVAARPAVRAAMVEEGLIKT